MLTQEALTNALSEAAKAAACCTTFCRLGSEVETDGYVIWHNGLGSSDTSVQRIYQATLLAMSETALSTKLQAWLSSCHQRSPVDLNEVAGFMISTEGRLVWLDDEQTTYESSAD